MKKTKSSEGQDGGNTQVTRMHILIAGYVVLAGVSVGIVATFLPDSTIGKLFLGGPRSIAWWLVLMIPVFLLERLGGYLERRASEPSKGASHR